MKYIIVFFIKFIFLQNLWCILPNYYVEILCGSSNEVLFVKNLLESQSLCEEKKIIISSSSLLLGPFNLQNAQELKEKILQDFNLYCNIYTETLNSNILVDEAFERNDVENESIAEDEFEFPISTYTKELTTEMLDVYTDQQAKKIITAALQLYAVPYKWGGTNIEKGIDCSFFVQYVFNELGIKLPRTSRQQYKLGTPVSKNELRCGDLVFFKKVSYRKVKGKIKKYEYINHVGIYLSNNEFIHATRGCKKVTISSLEEPYYKNRYAGARRIIKDDL